MRGLGLCGPAIPCNGDELLRLFLHNGPSGDVVHPRESIEGDVSESFDMNTRGPLELAAAVEVLQGGLVRNALVFVGTPHGRGWLDRRPVRDRGRAYVTEAGERSR